MIHSEVFVPIEMIKAELSSVIRSRWNQLFFDDSSLNLCSTTWQLNLSGAAAVVVPTRASVSIVSMRSDPDSMQLGTGLYRLLGFSNRRGIPGVHNAPILATVELTIFVATIDDLIAAGPSQPQEIPLTLSLDFRAFLDLSNSVAGMGPTSVARQARFLVVERVTPTAAAFLQFGANPGALGSQTALFGSSLQSVLRVANHLTATTTLVNGTVVPRLAVPLTSAGLVFLGDPSLGVTGVWNVGAVPLRDDTGVRVRLEYLSVTETAGGITAERNAAFVQSARDGWLAFFANAPGRTPMSTDVRAMTADIPTIAMASKIDELVTVAVEGAARGGMFRRTAGPTTVVSNEDNLPVFATRVGIIVPNICLSVSLFADITIRTRLVASSPPGTLEALLTVGVALEPSSAAACVLWGTGLAAATIAIGLAFPAGLIAAAVGTPISAATAGGLAATGGIFALTAMNQILIELFRAISAQLSALPTGSQDIEAANVGASFAPVPGRAGEMKIVFRLPAVRIGATQFPIRFAQQSLTSLKFTATPLPYASGMIRVHDVESFGWNFQGDCRRGITMAPTSSFLLTNIGTGTVNICQSPSFVSRDPTADRFTPSALQQRVELRDPRTENILPSNFSIAPGASIRVRFMLGTDALANYIDMRGGPPPRAFNSPVRVGIATSAGSRIVTMGTYADAARRSTADLRLSRELYIRERCTRPRADAGAQGRGRVRLPALDLPRFERSNTLVLLALQRQAFEQSAPTRQSIMQRLAAEAAQVPRVRRLPLQR